MSTKVCGRCGETKGRGEFSKQTASHDGLQNRCKVCARAANKAWVESNKERVQANRKAWYENNKERETARAREWNENNKERMVANQKVWRAANKEHHAALRKSWTQANPDRVNATGAKRRAAKLNRTMPWGCKEEIQALYAEARRLQEKTGVPHAVDHILPLQGALVSGLHIPQNLQVLTASENCSKSNNYDPWTGEHTAPSPEVIRELTDNLER